MPESKITQETIKQPFWSMSCKQVLDALKSDKQGITQDEVKKRKKIFGTNTIKKTQRLPKLRIILNQLKSPLIAILIGAGGITIFLNEWVDACVIFAAVIVNTGMGFWQENKAETVLEHLRSYVHTFTRVRRENAEHKIEAMELVPGDIIRLSLGDRVPADARVLVSNSCSVDESILTGESLPVSKKESSVNVSASVADRSNMLYSGTLVVEGFCDAVITTIGDQTEFGRIAALTSEREKSKTPLQRAVSKFAFWVGIIIGFLTLALFIAGLFTGYDVKDMFVLAVAVAVSSVPEGLPVALTVILAIGVERLAKRKGIVRKLLAAETLGSTSLILTDKTGTLTMAKMSLSAVLPYKCDETDFLSDVVLTTDVLVENPQVKPDKWRLSGRPMETSLVQEAGKRDVLLPAILKRSKIIDRVPFSSAQKYSMVTVEQSGMKTTIILGAPEVIADFTKLDKKAKTQILKDVERRAKTGERLLAMASHRGASKERGEFIFRGILSFRDPVRPTVKEAVLRMHTSGVRTVIVTGDHKGTAEAVAREVGIFQKGDTIITGDEMTKLRPKELEASLDKISVFARVSPEQKVQILRMYQKRGEIVAVTGDGVNDGPALKAADIGIAVGSGTEVAKGASDLIILDDNFETVVQAIEEGRRILGNIRKVIIYLLSNAADELFLIGGAIIAGLALPINALQILYVNFFSDSFPAIAYAFEPGDDEIRIRPSKNSTVLDAEMKVLILGVGTVSSALLFGLYLLLLRMGQPPEIVKTFIFASFATYTLFVAFSLRNLRTSILHYPFYSNKYLNGGVFFGITLTGIAIYVPFMQRILDTVSLPLNWVLGVLALSLFNVILVETIKWFFRIRSRKLATA
ncbi:MAG: HAD-IC family P-type ATPase [Patescibacteria group bacterium]|nr:HAD-IC family P-type ATPase [Patescibacteria group bacterium]